MDKGIRPACNRKFNEMLPERVNTREGNTAFRKAIMADMMDKFSITLASAATHYNHALIQAKKDNPTAVEGLGRPEDKKGGRKKKVPAIVQELIGSDTNSGAAQAPEAGSEQQQAAVPEGASQEQPAAQEEVAPAALQDAQPEQEAAPKLVNVYKKKDDSLVHEGLTQEAADALVLENNAKMFVSKLYVK